MSSRLEQLKIKPVPQIKETVEVGIPKQQEQVTLKTRIIDETKAQVFDRDAFMSKLTGKTDKEKQPSLQSKSPKIKPTTAEVRPHPIGTKIGKIKIGKKGTITPFKITKALTASRETPHSVVVKGDEIEINLPKEDDTNMIHVADYYMNNREVFVNFINTLFRPYKEELKDEKVVRSCSTSGEITDLLIHQKMVRDYLTYYTPYRGLLFYHGLGSGKTCASIATAESLKTMKKIIVMTPASLRTNYIKDIKKCGNKLFKTNQHWEFISEKEDADLMERLGSIMNISIQVVKRQGGVWLVNVKKKPNYDSLSGQDKYSINSQIDEMIHARYQFINYNGLRSEHLNRLSLDGNINPFDNSVVVIDEAHNFVSRIVNKIDKILGKGSVPMRLYKYLLSAQNAKIVLLTGTPVINFPNELGILFNILRGYIKTWKIPIDTVGSRKLDQKYFDKLLKNVNLCDYVEYNISSKMLTITRNPFGFIGKFTRKYEGVNLNEQGNIDDAGFMRIITDILENENIKISIKGINIINFKALPDKLDTFKGRFINDRGELSDTNLFKRRIMGLTSYFRSAQEELLPKYNSTTHFHIFKPEMSDYQFNIYEKARVQERKEEKRDAKKKNKNATEDLFEASSTYRIFSRAFCNFVFPESIIRPLPMMTKKLLQNKKKK